MATLNTAWNIAVSGLTADQVALNASANNTSNVNTPGYTREEPVFAEGAQLSLNGLNIGDGVSVVSVVSQRDRVLEQSLDQQTQTQQSTATRLTALQNVQGIFASATSTTATSGISSALSGFFNAVSSLEANASDTSHRTAVLSAASTLASSFSGAVSQLQQQQASLDAEGQSVVTQVNSLTKSIAALNTQISTSSPNSDAGTLEDQRQYDLNQLSQLVGINIITTENNGITVTATGGALLVLGGNAFALNSEPNAGLTHYTDSRGTDVTAALAAGGGQLGGYLTTRDTDIPQVETALDALAGGLATKLNTIQESGSTASGASAAGIPLFNVPATGGLPGSVASGLTVAITDPTQLAAGAAGAGPADGSNATLLAAVQNQALITLTSAGSPYQVQAPVSPTNFYADFVATLGSLVSQTSSLSTAQSASLAQTQTQRDSLSAVNTNDEASNLALLERSYQASSKVFSILDTVFASVLNLGEETTVA